MKAYIKEIKTVEVATLEIDAYIRYLEDTSFDFNGEWVNCDVFNLECPCMDDHQWRPIIDINTGKILNWSTDKRFWVFGKVCDEFKCKVKNGDGDTIIDYEGYVPSCMSINDEGYGDYIDMIVNTDGTIKNWNFTQDDIDYMIDNNLNN